MTSTAAPRTPSTRRFVRHFLEMVAAMFVGMLVLSPVSTLLFTLVGRGDLEHHPVVASLVMATTMTIGMTVWMRYRGHGWVSTAEMGAAMYLSFAVLFVPFWIGAVDGDTVLIAGHVLMLPAMLLVMLRRRGEYAGEHHPARG